MQASKREIIVDTAERLFYRGGFHATGIERVISEAGVARMTLYNHFPSKESLIEAVLERRYRRYLDELRTAIAARGSRSAILALTDRHAHWLRAIADRGCIVLKAIGEFEQHTPAIADLGRRLKGELLALIREALAQDRRPSGRAAAEQVLLVLEGANSLAPVLGSERAVDRLRALTRNPVQAIS